MPPSSQNVENNASDVLSLDLHNVDASEASRISQKRPLSTGSKHSVSFSYFVEVFDIPSTSDFTEEDIDSLWYSRVDMEIIRLHCHEIVARLDAGEVLDEDCTRGLERQTNDWIEKMTRVQSCANEAVFGIQKFQDLKGLPLPNLMAELYQSNAAGAQEDAHKRALRDAADIDLRI
jgi:hypothetical protein